MNSDYYFQKGLRLIVASAVIFALIVLFCVMVSRGFPLWLGLVLLVPAGLGVTGFYFFSVGSSADLSERFFRRFGRSQPRGEEKTTTEGVGSEQRCERSPDAIVPESAVVSVSYDSICRCVGVQPGADAQDDTRNEGCVHFHSDL